jgi:hypothetical protein
MQPDPKSPQPQKADTDKDDVPRDAPNQKRDQQPPIDEEILDEVMRDCPL